LAVEFALCMGEVDKLAKLWRTVSDEDKQGLARSLFEHIVFDLDTRQIVDFRLKPWADRWLVPRAALYDETGTEQKPKSPQKDNQGLYTDVPHRGLYGSTFPELDAAVQTVLQILYKDQPPPTRPLSNRVSLMQKRNDEIRSRFKAGETIAELSAAYGISKQRVHQIVKGRHR
jgi:hypothetical protein